jgi:hypothetical protein
MSIQKEPDIVIQARATLENKLASAITPLNWMMAFAFGTLPYFYFFPPSTGDEILVLLPVFFLGLIATNFYEKPEIVEAKKVLSMYEQAQKEAQEGEIQRAIQSDLQASTETDQPTLALDANHPLKAIALRVRDLGDDSSRVSKIIDDLLAHLLQTEEDLRLLNQATEAERELADSDSETHVKRLADAMVHKENTIDQLSTALRNLHVELTDRQDDDHSMIFDQVSDLIAGIAAETEVNEVVATAAGRTTERSVEDKWKQQARKSQKEGH